MRTPPTADRCPPRSKRDMSKKSMSRFARARHLSASEGGDRLPMEVPSMRMLRRLAVIGALVIVGLVGTTPAFATGRPAPVPARSVQLSALGTASAGVVADPSGPTPTTVAPAPLIDVTPSSEGMPGAGLVKQLLGWLSQLALWGSLASILAGATVYGLAQNAANYHRAYRGKH